MSSQKSSVIPDAGKRRAKDAEKTDKKAREKRKDEKKGEDDLDLDGLVDTERDARATALAKNNKQKGGE